MHFMQHATRAGIASVAALCLAACADDPVAATVGPRVTSLASSVGSAGGAFQFTPLASSYACTVSGGDPVHPVAIPAGFAQTIVASEPDFADAGDMNTQNENGPDAGRYLYRPSEGSIGEVSVTDLTNNTTKRFAFRADWEAMDPIVWTPWGTILVGEETNAASRRDPQYPNAVAGLVYELVPSAADPSVLAQIIARPALGSKSHEGMRFDNQGNLYSISERNPGYIFKFTPDKKGDLSSGQLYALKITSSTGDRTGEAEWTPLDRNAVQIDASVAADNIGATGYNRPEDVELATSTGNTHGSQNTLFVAVTSPLPPLVDNRILAIDLREPGGGSSHSTAFVYDYVKIGMNATSEFEWPDNLALDRGGNLYIAEDPGGSFATKRKGDDIWVARPGNGPHSPAVSVERFASLTDCDAEPTGIYFAMGGGRLFVNVQHRGGDHLDKAMAIASLR